MKVCISKKKIIYKVINKENIIVYFLLVGLEIVKIIVVFRS